jgi:hypothetical protein
MRYILKGTIVTLNNKRKVIIDGFVGINNQKISFVTSSERLRQEISRSSKEELVQMMKVSALDLDCTYN